MTTISSSVQVQKDILVHELSGEAVLLNLAMGEYFDWMRLEHAYGCCFSKTASWREF
jgi:hypothetical protein